MSYDINNNSFSFINNIFSSLLINTMSKYGDMMGIIQKKIPVGIKDPEGKDMMSEFQRYFNYISPNYKNIHNIVASNRDLFEEVSS